MSLSNFFFTFLNVKSIKNLLAPTTSPSRLYAMWLLGYQFGILSWLIWSKPPKRPKRHNTYVYIYIWNKLCLPLCYCFLIHVTLENLFWEKLGYWTIFKFYNVIFLKKILQTSCELKILNILCNCFVEKFKVLISNTLFSTRIQHNRFYKIIIVNKKQF